MSELSQLSPQPLWDIFAKICSIPHPSYHEEQLAEHIMGWAKEKGLHAERDQVGNILIRKGATAGMENRKPVALQAHLDRDGHASLKCSAPQPRSQLPRHRQIECPQAKHALLCIQSYQISFNGHGSPLRAECPWSASRTADKAARGARAP